MPDGGFALGQDLRLLPVAIRDSHGDDITPDGLAWKLRNVNGRWRLDLHLDDSSFPTPYVIDPAIVFGSLSEATASATTLVLAKPASVALNDVMIATFVARGGTGETITPPAGWTLIRRTDNVLNVSVATYYRVATAAESASWTWTVAPTNNLAGGIVAYRASTRRRRSTCRAAARRGRTAPTFTGPP